MLGIFIIIKSTVFMLTKHKIQLMQENLHSVTYLNAVCNDHHLKVILLACVLLRTYSDNYLQVHLSVIWA